MFQTNSLLKMVCMYLVYFLYTYFASYIVSLFSNVNETIVMLILDIIFLIFIVLIYRKNLQKDLMLIKKDYKISKVFKIVILGVLSVIFLNFIMGALTDLIMPGVQIDQNTQAIKEIASISMIYTVFKTMIFGVVAEELLFRESLSECVSNNVVFIILSATIYTAMNFIFTSSGASNLIMEIAIYFIPALLFSYIYTKNKRNIILVMFIKFTYNLIPLAILLAGAV